MYLIQNILKICILPSDTLKLIILKVFILACASEMGSDLCTSTMGLAVCGGTNRISSTTDLRFTLSPDHLQGHYTQVGDYLRDLWLQNPEIGTDGTILVSQTLAFISILFPYFYSETRSCTLTYF